MTNEEQRVSAYSRKDKPTNPSLVTAETLVGALNLNWREIDLPERVRTKHVHRLHPYLGKFIPQLVEIFLRKYFRAGQTILDPFCGSGTALVQANELGMHSVGYDISAFNVLLCRAKTAKYYASEVRAELLDILQSVRDVQPVASGQQDLWRRTAEVIRLTEEDSAYLQAWYAPNALRELLTYRRFIDTRPYKCKDLLRIVLCRSARSARLMTHYELDFPKVPQTTPYWCRKHSHMCAPTTDALKFLERYTLDTIRRIEEFANVRTRAQIVVRHADSRRARFPRVDGVITSPPYVGLIDYHEQHAYAYHLLGLRDRRTDEIGAAANGAHAEARSSYVDDVVEVFRRALVAMSEGGYMIVVAHDRSGLYGQIARRLGVKTEAIVERHVNRRTGMRSNEFFESVFIWRKQ
jgi:SAM-dependent methyltransferase